MDIKLVALVALRGVSTALALQGRVDASTAIDNVLAAYQSGKNVDAHMQRIADALGSEEGLADWDDITERINSEVDEFLDDGPVDPE